MNKSITFNASANVGQLLQDGDKALNENRFEDALNCYNKVVQLEPNSVSIYKKLAKAKFRLKQYEAAEQDYKTYLEVNKGDVDTIAELGETLRQQGKYSEALKTFEYALTLDKKNDLILRSIQETKNNILYCYDPVKASREKQEFADKNLRNALKMTVMYLTPEYMQDLADVQIKFGKTAQMGGTTNIAQYENYKNTITISDSYIYASPQVIAAYLVHESVHAKDNDPYTSVREEQDAYQTATRFWIDNSNGVKDPEMDYAADLYTTSPSSLSKRVEEIYVLRDPNIAKTSPNHPPIKKFPIGNTKKKAAVQSIQSYDVIA